MPSSTSTNGPGFSKVKTISMAFGVFLSMVLFAIPLALVYNFVFYKRSGILPPIILFILSWLLGYIATLLYYRISLKNDANAQIDKIDKAKALSILGTPLASYMIVALTLIGLAIAPSLINIFENTLGYLFIRLWNVKELCNDIFTSPTLDRYKDTSDTKYFDYGFLITRINKENVEEIFEYAKTPKDKRTTKPFPLDFDIAFGNTSTPKNIEKLRSLVELKRSFGHFSWIYFTSVISLFLSMISVTMMS